MQGSTSAYHLRESTASQTCQPHVWSFSDTPPSQPKTPTQASAPIPTSAFSLFFCDARGLQTFAQGMQEWRSVEPCNGCAVVNVGNSLRFLSGRKFRSVVHRVAPYPGETTENRSSCAYFVGPRMDVEFEDEKGEQWKSIDWHMRKYKSYREAGKTA
ncbi:uncharacterized protein FOBCDRAFT_292829 [Fusarium oxysporum Fo47]|uniref:Uncharacterized protein n=1 Tax=Fusarium oxysporum Fo47 TaxID=660027 RepID=W9JXG1_FUSOX|nr:uncharacterized protein FOBCDRAFT_292829 [Fusarium oxysporum Fo47]EWZ36741.1 hypothetical protein FOZG_10706 [Fusarium oxysporum Fo47]QKD54062.1 hypothetical protein FOBCDRAFT_292829 [Fusarium oxysporum Fo47]